MDAANSTSLTTRRLGGRDLPGPPSLRACPGWGRRPRVVASRRACRGEGRQMLRGKVGLTIAVLLWATALATEGRAGLVSLCEFQPSIDYECKNCTPTGREVPVALFNYQGQGSLKDITQ